MSVLEQSTIDEPQEKKDEVTEEAPYGYKADGTPRKRPGRPPGSAGGTGGRPRKTKNFDELKDPLAERLIEYFGPPIGFVSPLALAVLEDRADKTAIALCTLASTRPRIAKMITGMIAGSASVDLAMTGVALMVAVGVEMQRIDPGSMVSHYFNVDTFYVELYNQQEGTQENGHNPTGARGIAGNL